MKREYGDYLQDILIAIDETIDFTAGMEFEDFMADRKTINAVLRCLEVIGEASKNLPNEIQRDAADVPWRFMAGMRDKLIHEYFGVDLTIVWTVVREELPPLRPMILRLLG